MAGWCDGAPPSHSVGRRVRRRCASDLLAVGHDALAADAGHRHLRHGVALDAVVAALDLGRALGARVGHHVAAGHVVDAVTREHAAAGLAADGREGGAFAEHGEIVDGMREAVDAVLLHQLGEHGVFHGHDFFLLLTPGPSRSAIKQQPSYYFIAPLESTILSRYFSEVISVTLPQVFICYII